MVIMAAAIFLVLINVTVNNFDFIRQNCYYHQKPILRMVREKEDDLHTPNWYG